MSAYKRRYEGVNPPEINETRLWLCDFGRYTLGVTRQYTGDMYGRVGAHSWRYTLTLVKNP